MIGTTHLGKEDHVNKERFCSHCGEKKAGSQFISRSAKCRECRRLIWEANKIEQGLDPAQLRRDAKNERRRAVRLGLIPESTLTKAEATERMRVVRDHYSTKMIEQKGVCAICKEPETETHAGVVKQLCRDHDHKTGALRGLLCRVCNTAIGLLREKQENFLNAAAYLGKYK